MSEEQPRDSNQPGPPPRVLVVLAEQWPRALLRAALREAGYDAVGARTLAEALRYPARVPGRGAVGAIVVDQHALGDEASLRTLRERYANPLVVLLAHATLARPERGWDQVLVRPFAIADVVSTMQRMLPLPAGALPLDAV